MYLEGNILLASGVIFCQIDTSTGGGLYVGPTLLSLRNWGLYSFTYNIFTGLNIVTKRNTSSIKNIPIHLQNRVAQITPTSRDKAVHLPN